MRCSQFASDLLLVASLVLPLYPLSVLAEGWTVRRILDESHRHNAWRWAWLANGVTYGLIWEGLTAFAFNNWLIRRGISS